MSDELITVPDEFMDAPSVDFGVRFIPDWEALLSEGSGMNDWDRIVQLDSEYTVEDFQTGESVPAVSGTIQVKEQTAGVFEIRPASGLIIGIEFMDIPIVHTVWTALDSVKHHAGGGDRREWWNIPLTVGVSACGRSSFTDPPFKKFDMEDVDNYEEVREHILNKSVLQLPDFDSSVYLEENTFYFAPGEVQSLSDLRSVIE